MRGPRRHPPPDPGIPRLHKGAHPPFPSGGPHDPSHLGSREPASRRRGRRPDRSRPAPPDAVGPAPPVRSAATAHRTGAPRAKAATTARSRWHLPKLRHGRPCTHDALLRLRARKCKCGELDPHHGDSLARLPRRDVGDHRRGVARFALAAPTAGRALRPAAHPPVGLLRVISRISSRRRNLRADQSASTATCVTGRNPAACTGSHPRSRVMSVGMLPDFFG